jgi:hypothetical protein
MRPPHSLLTETRFLPRAALLLDFTALLHINRWKSEQIDEIIISRVNTVKPGRISKASSPPHRFFQLQYHEPMLTTIDNNDPDWMPKSKITRHGEGIWTESEESPMRRELLALGAMRNQRRMFEQLRKLLCPSPILPPSIIDVSSLTSLISFESFQTVKPHMKSPVPGHRQTYKGSPLHCGHNLRVICLSHNTTNTKKRREKRQ